MKILILCYEFPPLGGGGAQVVAGLAKHLAHQGHSVDVATSGWPGLPQKETIGGVNIYRVSTRRSNLDRSSPFELACYLTAMAKMLRTHLKNHTYDVCNCHFIFPDGVLTPLVKHWSGGIPIVTTAHGSDVPGYNPERFQLLHRFLKPIWKRQVASANLIICPSSTIEKLIRGQEPLASTINIPNGFDPTRYYPRAELSKHILVVSRLFKRKGVNDLISAFSKSDLGFELHIVGDGPQRNDLEAQVRTNKFRDRIFFHGWIDNNDPKLKEIYERSAIFVLPSYAENFPVSLLEAMAAGTAIITTRATGCEDVVSDSGLLFDAGNIQQLHVALVRLTKDRHLRDQLASAARKKMEMQYSWQTVAQQYETAFSDQLVLAPEVCEVE